MGLERRVIAAHEALQLGELADHLGREVGLGQPRRLLGQRRVRADMRGDLPRQRGDALHALALSAELLVEADGVQLLEPLLELHGLVRLPEEAGVGEAGADDAGVAGDDRRAAVLRLGVGRAMKRLARRPDFGSRTTSISGWRGSSGARPPAAPRELLLEAPHQRHAAFDEAGDLGGEPLVLDEFQPLREAELPRLMQDRTLRRSGSAMTFAASSFDR